MWSSCCVRIFLLTISHSFCLWHYTESWFPSSSVNTAVVGEVDSWMNLSATDTTLYFLLAGKNDGSVGGHRYFSCKPGYGVLVRPDRLSSHDRTTRRTEEMVIPTHVPILRGEGLVPRRGENRKSWSSWDSKKQELDGRDELPTALHLLIFLFFSSLLCNKLRLDTLPPPKDNIQYIYSEVMDAETILKERQQVDERWCRVGQLSHVQCR